MQHSPLIHLLFLKHLNELIAMYWIGSKYFFTVTWRTQYRYIDNPHILIQIYIGYTDTRTHLHIKIYYFITIMYPCIRCFCRKNNRKSWIYLCIRLVSVLCPSSCCNMHWWLLKAWKIIQYPLKFPVDELSDIFKQCLFTQRPPVVAFFSVLTTGTQVFYDMATFFCFQAFVPWCTDELCVHFLSPSVVLSLRYLKIWRHEFVNWRQYVRNITYVTLRNFISCIMH